MKYQPRKGGSKKKLIFLNALIVQSLFDGAESKVATVSKIEFGEIDFQAIASYLSSERSFSLDRVETSLNRLKKAKERKSHTLEQWMG